MYSKKLLIATLLLQCILLAAPSFSLPNVQSDDIGKSMVQKEDSTAKSLETEAQETYGTKAAMEEMDSKKEIKKYMSKERGVEKSADSTEAEDKGEMHVTPTQAEKTKVSEQSMDSETPSKYPKRTDKVDRTAGIDKDLFLHGTKLSYQIPLEELKQMIDEAEKEGKEKEKWKEVLDPHRVSEFYIYGPRSFIIGNYRRRFPLGRAILSTLVEEYEKIEDKTKDPQIVSKYSPRENEPVNPNTEFIDMFELGLHLSLKIDSKELKQWIETAKKEGKDYDVWYNILDDNRVKEYYSKRGQQFKYGTFEKEGYENLFRAIRDIRYKLSALQTTKQGS